MNEEIRVRIAPSPTGKFHLGTARAALFNYLFAKHKGGKFILRIEDTDKERSQKEYELDIINGLQWLGLNYDEGPLTEDARGPYRQSEREKIYKDYIEKLLNEGKAYRCFCSPEELEAERNEAQTNRLPYIYSGKCRNISQEEVEQKIAKGEKYIIRFKTPEKIVEFDDLIRGNIKIDTKTIGDFVIVKSDGTPLFLLASAVDDALMNITHVIRGEDHISNTPKQLMLFEALNFNTPIYGHLPLVVNPDHTKLSKRKNPTSITEDFKEKGYLADAMINFLVLMGWNPGDNHELFTLHQLEKEWQIENVGKSPSVFDIKKLEYLNGYYIRQLQLGEFADLAKPFILKIDPELAKKIDQNKEFYLKAMALIQERVKKLEEVPNLINYFFNDDFAITLDHLLAKKIPSQVVEPIFAQIIEICEKNEIHSRDDWEVYLRGLARKNNIPDGALLWAVRYALTGEIASPGAFEILEVLPCDSLIKRFKKVLSIK